MQREAQDDACHDANKGVRVGEAKNPGPTIMHMSPGQAARHADNYRRMRAAAATELELQAEAGLPLLPPRMRRRYERWWDEHRHPAREWWEVREGEWRRRRVWVWEEVDDISPEQQERGEEDDRRESQRVRWDRSPAVETTRKRLLRELKKCNSVAHGTEPEIHMTGTKKTETRESTNQLTNDDTMTRLDHAIGGAETRASDKFTGHCSTCRAWPTRSSAAAGLYVVGV